MDDEHRTQCKIRDGRHSQRLTQRTKVIAERYDTTLAQLTADVKLLEEKVTAHLTKIDFVWE
ncbi:MAG: hypothetical protein ABIQ27_05070 [Flavobacterium sp.]|uniref:hypothetical protein n=1 Tax=Flavobacterium sp. TaxID=239 RepID=UPI00326474EB